MTFLIFLWGLRSLGALLGLTAFWQVKEYRLDRAWAHAQLGSTRARLLHPLGIAKWAGLTALLQPGLVDVRTAAAILTFAYAFESIGLLRALSRGTLRRPHPTVRALTILAGSTALTVAAVLLGATHWQLPLVLLGLDRLLPLGVAAVTLATVPAATAGRTRTIARAAARLKEHPSLTTIGITGSMGKSSTKEFLATILERHYSVVKTPANVNTEIGVAGVLLRDLRDSHDVFICEMGAYRRGEIARLAALTRPAMGILTAIGDQHLALFGSRHAIAEAKGELLRALPPAGTAIVNGDDPLCRERASETPARRVLTYGRGPDNDVRATDVAIGRDTLSLTVEVAGERVACTLGVLGAGAMGSILAATAAAHALGMPLADIAAAAETIRRLPRTMEPRVGPNGARVIDDTYSANVAGVLAALAYLGETAPAGSVVVLAPLIELGAAARTAHRQIGEALGRLNPQLTILTSTDFATELKAGARRARPGNPPLIHVEPSADRARRTIDPLITPETTILLEGRIPERLRASLFHPRGPRP